MGEGKASSLLVILVVILSLVAFGFAIAAEKRRSLGHIESDENNTTYCVYNSDVATGYGTISTWRKSCFYNHIFCIFLVCFHNW
ncbi:uncharacterized protein LOC116257336 isoform X2 [Nymphaea colorata]|uniref:uncharacterized protein LOC116257336 isoform X2 n=1 Tax=Nymphaea colorata TaxID=210225 RepID=UPI00129E8D41|nr:uncharacterized protein LOC116257336 isoform X2 [Nymphaea colorata]